MNAIDLAVRGMVVGIVASAPMGPVGVLTVQRTLNKGRWYGFATGCGAAMSDLIYAVMTGDDPDGVFECDCKPGVHHTGDILQRSASGQQMPEDVHGASQQFSLPSVEGWFG